MLYVLPCIQMAATFPDFHYNPVSEVNRPFQCAYILYSQVWESYWVNHQVQYINIYNSKQWNEYNENIFDGSTPP